MKLSEMTVQEAAKTITRITLPVRRITKDEEAIALLKEVGALREARTMLDVVNAILDAVPLLLDKHYADIVAITAAMTGNSAKQIEAMKLNDLLHELRGCLDDEYVRFFTSSMRQAMKDANES